MRPGGARGDGVAVAGSRGRGARVANPAKIEPSMEIGLLRSRCLRCRRLQPATPRTPCAGRGMGVAVGVGLPRAASPASSALPGVCKPVRLGLRGRRPRGVQGSGHPGSSPPLCLALLSRRDASLRQLCPALPSSAPALAAPLCWTAFTLTERSYRPGPHCGGRAEAPKPLPLGRFLGL